MALGKKKKKASKKTKSKGNWLNVGTIWNNEVTTKSGEEIEIRNFGVHKECMLFVQDPESEKFYRVKQMNVRDPHESAPESALVNLSIDLENEYHVEEADED